MAIRKLITRNIFHHARKSSLSATYAPFRYLPIHSLSRIQAFHQSNLHSLVFQKYGISPSQLPNFLEKNSFLLKLFPSDIEKSLKILLSLMPCQDFLVATVCDFPAVLDLEFLEKWQHGISQLGIHDISPMAIRNVLEVGRKFKSNTDDVYRYVKCLKGLGFSDDTIVKVMEAVPILIMSNENEICSIVYFLMSFGLHRTEINRIICLFPGVLIFEVENRLRPLLEEFTDLGFSSSEIRREVVREPMILGLEIGELTHCLEMLRSLKCRLGIKEEIFRHGEFRAAYSMKLRIDCLRKHGLIYRDAFGVVGREPRMITYDIEDIDKKVEFLMHEMKYDIQCLVEVPEYLGVNFDKQIVPRFRVIQYLRLNNALGDEVRLRDLIKLSRLRFYNMYVKPYPKCEEIYGRYVGERKTIQSRHPVGMWRIFRPQQHPKSKADLQNIKTHMDLLP